MVDADIGGHRLLEGIEQRAAYVAPGGDDVEHRPLDVRPRRLELGNQVEKRDTHRQRSASSRIAIGMKAMPLTARSGPVCRKPSFS